MSRGFFRREHVREALVATSIAVAFVFLMFFGRAQAFGWRLTPDTARSWKRA